ncbi:MAG TPA: flagellar type III secretion system pore protein FliP [Patescibacteria group bacterium]|jgi:flagellar biosynthetic protein FliP|nr:flagellar type III secretion system pore protein FliP [Patescibacteria group bacterium]
MNASILRKSVAPVILATLLLSGMSAAAQTNFTTGIGPVQISLGGQGGVPDVDTGIKVLFAMTLLTLAPSILLLMTCFTRIVIVLSFVRTALQLQGTPANQIIIGLSLFITYFVMAPVWDNINRDALAPYQAQQITSTQAMDRASHHLSVFMLKQTRPKDVELFVSMAKIEPSTTQDLPLRVVIPAFIISELRTAFQMGFLIYVPFILIDLIVATVLMSMGMMMMPPTTISLPLKILLFVLVDGWDLVIHSLVRSFGM